MSSKNWKTFLKFLTNSNVYLLLRIVNLSLQIIINDRSEFDKVEEFEEERPQQLKFEKVKVENIEIISDCTFDDVIVKKEPKINDIIDDQICKPKFNERSTIVDQSQDNSKKSSINLEYLNECISKVNIFEFFHLILIRVC